MSSGTGKGASQQTPHLLTAWPGFVEKPTARGGRDDRVRPVSVERRIFLFKVSTCWRHSATACADILEAAASLRSQEAKERPRLSSAGCAPWSRRPQRVHRLFASWKRPVSAVMPNINMVRPWEFGRPCIRKRIPICRGQVVSNMPRRLTAQIACCGPRLAAGTGWYRVCRYDRHRIARRVWWQEIDKPARQGCG